MTPLEIQIAITYACTSGQYRDGDFSAPAVREAIDKFKSKDLLIEFLPNKYESTERLRAFVSMLEDVPLPEYKWINPITKETVGP